MDVDSFETYFKARMGQAYRDQVRKHTKEAMYDKAEEGRVTGGITFGYNKHRVAKRHVEWVINDAQAAVVVQIYDASQRAKACGPSPWR